MSHSLPSREIYAVDVPEVKNFEAWFRYNFFTPDEQINEISGIPARMLYRRSADDDIDYTQYLDTRVPRYIMFQWNKTRLKEPGHQVIESDVRAHARQSAARRTLIADNYDKIVDEDHFSSYNYLAVTYHDGEIDDKIFNLVSGSYEQLTLDEPKQPHASPHKAASMVSAKMPSKIQPHFAFSAMTLPKSSGVSHFNTGNNRVLPHAVGRRPIHNTYMKRLKTVYLHSQINARLFNDITNRNIRDPHSPFPLDMHTLQKSTSKLSLSLKNRIGQSIHESEFKVMVPYINLRVDKTSHHAQRKGAEIVGYVIDKYEIAPNGSTKQLQPVIVEHPESHYAIDFRVKYNVKYMYTIRTIVLFHLPAIDHDTGDIATIQILVSSKPSNKVNITIHENVAPPPPADINFTWNYETEKLLVHWCFPPNSQRDIKRFQVFRRKDTNHPFELLREFNFDDSAVHMDSHERPAAHLVSHLTSPVTFYIDDDFKKDSSYIYTVCSIDAHGLTSCYGAQYQLGFDIFKNQLTKKLISHSGAPKPYPNLYLEGSGFVDVAHAHGPHSKRMRLYFTPQYYMLEDDHGRTHRVLATKQTRGSYKFQFINADNQKMDLLTVTINDIIRAAQSKIAFPKFTYNVPRKMPSR